MPPTAVAPILSPPIPYPHQMRRQEGGKSTERARSGGGQIRHERQLLPRLGAQSPSSLPPWSPPPRVELLPPWKWRAFFYPAGHGAAAPWKEGLELVEFPHARLSSMELVKEHFPVVQFPHARIFMEHCSMELVKDKTEHEDNVEDVSLRDIHNTDSGNLLDGIEHIEEIYK
ncbi:hypothetical protein TRIUR3_09401 [Triticum urartu]|uniref:Uncharacterized protein n=1 Tax=Triticum urartu TaxID=4572 RepID=M7YW78_TRIUA|nr:hypothetical protein TRIUR3_09401 [Triticum urartu]